jgi:hypothetical protein
MGILLCAFCNRFFFFAKRALLIHLFVLLYMGSPKKEGWGLMKYASIIKEMGSRAFRRQDALDAIRKAYPDYNGAFTRDFARLLSQKKIARVGEDLYVLADGSNAKPIYEYNRNSDLLSEVTDFLATAFPLADFLAWETVQLNEFFNHQIAHNTVVVETESMLMESFFEKLRERYPATIFEPSIEEYQRYAESGSVIVERLSSRYPKNKGQQHGFSLEKLTADLFANRLIKAFVNEDDYAQAIENIFAKYQINETRLFNYARTRRVEERLRDLIKTKTAVKLYTDKGNK